MKNNINKIESNWLEQKNTILELNPDRVFWIYETVTNSWNNIELKLQDDLLVCFENQIENIDWLKNMDDLCILDLKEFSKWRIKFLHWNKELNIDNLSMASWWVIEFFEAKNKWKIDWKVKNNIHIITTLRDWWSTSENQRTTTAWRLIWEDISEEIEREHTEEAPFLVKKNWEYYLSISSSNNENINILFSAIENFLEYKYNPEDKEKADLFEKSFTWIKYKDLKNILLKIVRNNRVTHYSYDEINDISGMEELKKEVTIWWKKWTYYWFYNENLRTWEFKSMRKFNKFPDWVEWLWKLWRPTRFFFESFNQSPRFTRIENAADKNPANAIKIIVNHMKENSEEIISDLIKK